MEVILDTIYLEVIHDYKNSCSLNRWKATTQNMTDTEFKKNLIIFSDLVLKKKIKYIIINGTDYYTFVKEDIQKWYDQVIAPKYILSGIKKIAIILPIDAISALSIEQTFRKNNASVLNVGYFQDKEEADIWIKE